MLAISSTVLALPQMKSECPAAEQLYQKAPLRCEKSSEFFSEMGDMPTSKVHQNALFPYKKSKLFREGAQPHPHWGGGVPTPLGACGASNPRLRRGLDAFGVSTLSRPSEILDPVTGVES